MRSSQQREEAVKLVTEGGLTIPEAGRRLSIAPSTLRYWVKASREDKNAGNKQKPLTEIEVELARVKRELARSVIMSNKITRRQSIVQAAIEVFSKKGFQTANISEIAQRAGIADATIYKYFKNKEDLFFAIPIEKFAVSSNCIWKASQVLSTKSGSSYGTFSIFSRRTLSTGEYCCSR
jgi:transposase-like protein